MTTLFQSPRRIRPARRQDLAERVDTRWPRCIDAGSRPVDARASLSARGVGAGLHAAGISALDVALIALFAVTLPWIVIGFWNAVIGLLIMRCARDPVAAVFPAAARVRGRRADHALDRGAGLHSQRAARARRRAISSRCWRSSRRPGRGAVSRLCAERHHRFGARRRSRKRAFPSSRRRGASASPSPTAGAAKTPASRPATSAISARALAMLTISPFRSTPTASCRRPPCCGWCA